MIRKFELHDDRIYDVFDSDTMHLFHFMNDSGKKNGVILAGGSMRSVIDGSDIVDFDFFFTGQLSLDMMKSFLYEEGYKNTFSCPKGELFSFVIPYDTDSFIKVQLIAKRFYSGPIDLLDSFDFTACLFAWDGTDFYTSVRAVRDVKKKYLRLWSLTYPTATINRMYKYRAKGYYIGDCIKDTVVTINSMVNYDPVEDQLYVD